MGSVDPKIKSINDYISSRESQIFSFERQIRSLDAQISIIKEKIAKHKGREDFQQTISALENKLRSLVEKRTSLKHAVFEVKSNIRVQKQRLHGLRKNFHVDEKKKAMDKLKIAKKEVYNPDEHKKKILSNPKLKEKLFSGQYNLIKGADGKWSVVPNKDVQKQKQAQENKKANLDYLAKDYQKDVLNFWVGEVNGAGKAIKHTVIGLGKFAWDYSPPGMAYKQIKETAAFVKDPGGYIKKQDERGRKFLEIISHPGEVSRAVYAAGKEGVIKNIEPFKKGDMTKSGEVFGSFLTEIALFAAPFSKSAKTVALEKRMQEFAKLTSESQLDMAKKGVQIVSQDKITFAKQTLLHSKESGRIASEMGRPFPAHHDVVELVGWRKVARLEKQLKADIKDIQKFEELLMKNSKVIDKTGKSFPQLQREFYRAFDEMGAAGNKYRLFELWRSDIKEVPLWVRQLIREGKSNLWVDVGKFHPKIMEGLSITTPDPIALMVHRLAPHHQTWLSGKVSIEAAADFIEALTGNRFYRKPSSLDELRLIIENNMKLPPGHPRHISEEQGSFLYEWIGGQEAKGVLQ